VWAVTKVDRELKMHLVKRFVNLAVRLVYRIIPDVEPSTYQGLMAKKVFACLWNAYKVQVYDAVFDDVSQQTLNHLKDRNFQRLLRLAEKLVLYLGENDRYYRQWLGFAMLKTKDALDSYLKVSYGEFLEAVKNQWEIDLTGVLPKEFFDAHKRDCVNILFAPNLTYLPAYETLLKNFESR
jgi:hypothetical protein